MVGCDAGSVREGFRVERRTSNPHPRLGTKGRDHHREEPLEPLLPGLGGVYGFLILEIVNEEAVGSLIQVFNTPKRLTSSVGL